jgi:hypothetical protein
MTKNEKSNLDAVIDFVILTPGFVCTHTMMFVNVVKELFYAFVNNNWSFMSTGGHFGETFHQLLSDE